MRKKFAVLTNSLGPNQLSLDLITSGNRAIDNKLDLDFICFTCNSYNPPNFYRFMSANISEAYDYPFPIISTDVSLAAKSLRFPGPSKHALLVWDLDWLRAPKREFEPFNQVYNDERLDIFCRSKEHAQIMKSVWGRHAKLVNQSDLVGELFKYYA